jgi:hypothetical protein
MTFIERIRFAWALFLLRVHAFRHAPWLLSELDRQKDMLRVLGHVIVEPLNPGSAAHIESVVRVALQHHAPAGVTFDVIVTTLEPGVAGVNVKARRTP